MALQRCGLNVNKSNKEMQPHGSVDFPCAAYSQQYDDIVWHWHEEVEIAYVKNGEANIKIPGKKFVLREGDGMIINSNVLHSAEVPPKCELRSLVFDQRLISGGNETAFSLKYIKPLVSGKWSGYFLDRHLNRLQISRFNAAFDAMEQEPYGFEFIVRENLSAVCLFLCEQLSLNTANAEEETDSIRLRKMLDFIHNHFETNLMLADIADAADIGTRECLRCFNRTIGVPPMKYLLKYRVMKGAEGILRHPSKGISEIAAMSGFDSPSNFSKLFKRFYGCSPSEYRKKEFKHDI